MSKTSVASTGSTLSFAEHLDARVSERMRRIVDFAIPGRPTWDLCCDHGLIGLWAWHIHDLPELHFVDRAPKLAYALRDRIAGHMDLAGLSFHACDAVQIELPSVSSNVLISGIGFRACKRIISNIDPTQGHRIVTSVHSEAEQLPLAMNALGWTIAGESTVHEGGRTLAITAWDGSR